MVDQGAKQALSLWQRADLRRRRPVDPGVQELLEQPVGAYHAEGGVSSPGEEASGIDDAVQDLRQIQLGSYRVARPQETA